MPKFQRNCLFPLIVLLPLTSLQVRAEKIWTNAVSGLWQDGTNWTGHTPPNVTSFIQITNDQTKTITINALTPASTMTVQMLRLNAPIGATNTLLLSDAGTNNPLTFQTGLELKDGAALRITNSALLLQLTNDHVDIDGTLTLDSGFIDFGDITVTARVGRVTSGVLSINSGMVSAGAITVGGLTNSTGLLTMSGGQLLVSSLMSVGRNPSTVGTARLLGGQMSVLNDDTRVGDEGIGIMLISNATASLTNLQVGRNPASAGSLTLAQGGLIQVQSDAVIARFGGSTGLVTVAGGQLLAPALSLYVGRGGAGQLSLSNGLVQAARVLVAADRTNSIGSSGLLSIAGGTMLVSSNLSVGSASYSTGEAAIQGGAVVVTNAQGTAVFDVSSGGLTLSGGTLITDRLQATNGSAHFMFSGGTVDTKNTLIANGSPFVLGDGTSTAILRLSGGTHTFANGLVISSNSVLEGCGTIIGSIINHGTISTNCGGGGTVIPPSITSQPTGQVLAQGGVLNVSVVAGGSSPLSYQWMHGSGIITGATAASFSKTNVQSSDAGEYTVVITNSAGAITSAVAIVSVEIPPSITTPPQNLTAAVGSAATFSVAATGTSPLSYQWQFGGTNIVGATTSTFVKNGVQMGDAGTYSVVVTNLAGSTSSSAQLQVLTGVTISFVSRIGSTNVISVQSGTGLNYVLGYKDSLRQTNWTQLLPSTAGTGGLLLLRDPFAAGTERFYRVLSF